MWSPTKPDQVQQPAQNPAENVVYIQGKEGNPVSMKYNNTNPSSFYRAPIDAANSVYLPGTHTSSRSNTKNTNKNNMHHPKAAALPVIVRHTRRVRLSPVYIPKTLLVQINHHFGNLQGATSSHLRSLQTSRSVHGIIRGSRKHSHQFFPRSEITLDVTKPESFPRLAGLRQSQEPREIYHGCFRLLASNTRSRKRWLSHKKAKLRRNRLARAR